MLLGALALRVWGINFGFPAIYRPDEDVVVGRAMGMLHGVLDPHFVNWPHLYLYVSAGWLALLKPVFPLLGPSAPYFGVRLLDAAIGTVTVLAVYRLGRRAYGEATGLLAAVMLAVAFLAVRDSHFATLDTPLTFACLLGVSAASRLAETGNRRWGAGAGVLFGLAASIKYNGALVLASVAVAQGLRARNARRSILGLVVITAMGAVAFVVTSPFLVLDLGSFAGGISYIVHHLRTAHQPEIGYLHIPRLALWYGLDPPLFLLSLVGVLVAAIRRTRTDLIVLAFVLTYYAVIGAGYSVFVRYADPLVPPLALLAARALIVACARLQPRVVATTVAAAIVVVPAVAHDLAFDHLIQQTDTRTQAFDWLERNVPSGARVATLYFAGPAHDQAMIDRRDQSHGATDPYVASFLQNRLEVRYTVHGLAESDLNHNDVAVLRADGVDYVVESPVAPAGGCGPALPLETALKAQTRLRATFSPTHGRCTNAVFDPLDGYYVPLSDYEGWAYPGPTIRVFELAPVP